MRKMLSRMPLLVCIVSLAAAVYLGYDHFAYRAAMMDRQKAELLQITRHAARDLDRVASEVMHAADAVAEYLSAREASEAVQREAESRLRQVLTAHPTFYGATVSYRPFAFKKDRRLYSAYLVKENGELVFKQLDRVYDYTNGKYPWYSAAMEKGSRWSPPYFDAAAKTLMTTYSALFFKADAATGKRVPQGLVTIDVSLDEVKNVVESLSLGVGGYGALVSQDGTYLYHPTSAYAATGQTILDVARQKNDAERLFLAEMLRENRVASGILDHVSVTTGLPSWLAYEPVPSAHWLLINTFIKEDVPVDSDKLRRQLLLLTCSVVLFLIALIFLVLHDHAAGAGRVWWLAALTSMLTA